MAKNRNFFLARFPV